MRRRPVCASCRRRYPSVAPYPSGLCVSARPLSPALRVKPKATGDDPHYTTCMTRPFIALALAFSTFGAVSVQAQESGPPQISAQRLSDMTRELASEPYAGRGPGGPGEPKTIDFI